MKKTALKVTLFEKDTITKEWEQPSSTDLPALIQALKIVKVSVNDYLSNLICTQKDVASSDQMERTENSEAEEDTNDNISGFNKYKISVNEKPVRREKRKVDFLNQVKKVKK